VVLRQRFGVSERRACRVAGQHRSLQQRPLRPVPGEEARLRRRLRSIARRHPRWGWRMAHALLRGEGTVINKKRTRRLWREEGLRRPAPCKRKRSRPAPGTELLRATRPNEVWAIDFQFDETSDGRRIKLTNIVDEFTREALAMRVARNCTADDVIATVAGLVAQRGAPAWLRMDNGPELMAHGLRDWCRITGVRTHYIEPGSPWENPFVESFNARVPGGVEAARDDTGAVIHCRGLTGAEQVGNHGQRSVLRDQTPSCLTHSVVRTPRRWASANARRVRSAMSASSSQPTTM
jgi:putative transposase